MSAETENRWVTEHESTDGKLLVLHWDGVPWNKARKPFPLHRCRAQSELWKDWVYLTQRCACGAYRIPPHGWFKRNSR